MCELCTLHRNHRSRCLWLDHWSENVQELTVTVTECDVTCRTVELVGAWQHYTVIHYLQHWWSLSGLQLLYWLDSNSIWYTFCHYMSPGWKYCCLKSVFTRHSGCDVWCVTVIQSITQSSELLTHVGTSVTRVTVPGTARSTHGSYNRMCRY